MNNGEKYAGATHNHYVYECMCPTDFKKCLIKDAHDYQDWLLQEADEES